MSQEINKERLSALLDSELTEFEVRQVLRDSSDDELQTMSRWQLAQDALKGKPAALAPDDFAAQIQAAIGQAPRETQQPWWSGIAKTMVAASVAAATVLVGWQYWQVDEGAAGFAPTSAAAPSSLQSTINNSGPRAEFVSQRLNPEAEETKAADEEAAQELMSPLLNSLEGAQQPQIHFIGEEVAQ